MPHDAGQTRRGRLPGDVRVAIRRPRLPRTLGAGALFAACYGNVGSSIYYSLGVTAALALGLTPLALILASFIFVTTALNYAEGTSAMPHAGGSSAFARHAFNQPLGFIVGWIQLLNYTATVSISSYTATAYLAVLGEYVPFLHALTVTFWHILVSCVLVAVLMGINIVGIQESSVINLVLALLDLGTQLVLVVLGMTLLLNWSVVIHNIHWGIAPTWGNFLASISLAMVTFTGIETISNMSEEAKNPGKTVPKATFLVIIAVLLVSSFLPTVGMSVFPVHLDSHHQFVTDLASDRWKNDPVSGIVTFFHPAALAYWAGIWVAILAFTILVIATNAGLIGISRLSYSLASNNLFPRPFATLHPKFNTPWVSIVVFGILAAILILPNQIDLMAAVYSLAATFAFCTAHLSVMRLRYVHPELVRPYRMPFNIPFGRAAIPVLSVVGALAIGAVFTQLLFQNISNSTPIYIVWAILGSLSFVVYRKARNLPVWEPLASPPMPQLRVAYVRPALPAEPRVRLGRRGGLGVVVPPDPQKPESTRRVKIRFEGAITRDPRKLLEAAGLALLGVGAVTLDLSQYDPFGPGISWSLGFVAIVLIVAFMVLRSRAEA